MFTLKQKLYQMFILGTSGGEYKSALENNLGGIIFFSDDIKTPEQFSQLTEECNNSALTPPFLSIDQEGGRVERTENIHNGKKYLSAKFAYEKGEDFLTEQTKNIAQELKSYGINMNFAPCVDVNTNAENPIIGERAFSNKTDEVIKGGILCAGVYRKNGIIPCAKHFPGHGDANCDSHKTLPEIKLDFEDLKENHIRAFKSMIDTGIETIMVAHLKINHFGDLPTSLNKNAIGYLRKELRFKGVAISDDMIMKGVSGIEASKACETGIRAGLNMFIYRNSTPETIRIIDDVYEIAQNDLELQEKINDSFEKIIALKTAFGIIK